MMPHPKSACDNTLPWVVACNLTTLDSMAAPYQFSFKVYTHGLAVRVHSRSVSLRWPPHRRNRIVRHPAWQKREEVL